MSLLKTFFRYKKKNYLKQKLFTSLFWIIICLGIGIGIVSQPAVVFQAAKMGLQIWWEIVFPSLLPFFVISELLMNLGFVAFLGVFLEPAMRPLFNLPGASGFILAVSLISGFPLSAILTTRLRQANLCTREEGEQLMSFTNNASPLFMLGAVSIGMFQNPTLGPPIAFIHYSSNLICGVLLKFFYSGRCIYSYREPKEIKGSFLRRAFKALQEASRLKKQSFGSLLGEAVRNTITALLTIGGFITLFSVLLGILQAIGFFAVALKILSPIVKIFQVHPSLLQGLLTGFFEITMGINEISKSESPLIQQLMATEVILAWNGVAVQAQIAGMITESDLRIFPYLLTRYLQIPLAVSLTYLLFLSPFQNIFTQKSTLTWPALMWLIFILAVTIISLSLLGVAYNVVTSWYKKIIIIR